MARGTKSPLVLCVVAWAGGVLFALSSPSAGNNGSMDTSSSIVDTKTTSARYTSDFIPDEESLTYNGSMDTSSIVDTKTTSARYTSELISDEESLYSWPTSSDGLCVASNPVCLADADCAACLVLSSRQGDSGAPCDTRYPAHLNSSSTVCQLAAAIYCCYYEDKSTAESCLDNKPTALYWDCIVTSLGIDCIIEDMPCYGGVLAEAPIPFTGSPTFSPTAAAFDSSRRMATASPSVGVPTSSPSITPGSQGIAGTSQAPSASPSSTPSDGPTTSPTVGESNDNFGDLNGASGLAVGALALWRLVLFAWGLGVWLSTILGHLRY